MANWSVDQYLLFEEERARPLKALLDALPTDAAVRRACDLGCGPGNSTASVCQKYPDATVVGVDNSEAMIDRARTLLPDVQFEFAAIEDWRPQTPIDLIFSNAAFHWVTGHVDVMVRLMGSLQSGGLLAIQVPDNEAEPSHTTIKELSLSSGWAPKIGDLSGSRDPIHLPEHYVEALQPLSALVDVWRTTYHLVLPDVDAIVQWFKGSALRPVLSTLSERDGEAFVIDYRNRLEAHYKPISSGAVVLAFPRLFIVAAKA